METGTQSTAGTAELSKQATAYLVSVAFCLTYLLSQAAGAGNSAALTRGVGVGLATLVLGRFLARPAIDAVMAAMARDRAEQERKNQEESE